jgi:hypothetical protein
MLCPLIGFSRHTAGERLVTLALSLWSQLFNLWGPQGNTSLRIVTGSGFWVSHENSVLNPRAPTFGDCPRHFAMSYNAGVTLKLENFSLYSDGCHKVGTFTFFEDSLTRICLSSGRRRIATHPPMIVPDYPFNPGHRPCPLSRFGWTSHVLGLTNSIGCCSPQYISYSVPLVATVCQ